MKTYTHLLAASLLATASFPTHAQEQTVEGAQLFLQKVSEQGSTIFTIGTGNSEWNEINVQSSYCRYHRQYTSTGLDASEHRCSDFRESTYVIDAYKLTLMAALTRCTTQVNAPTRSTSTIYPDASGKDYRTIRFNHIPQAPFQIEWGKAAEIEQDGSYVTIRGINPALRFHFASEALATRIAFAMEFLRTSCDSTSGTGF